MNGGIGNQPHTQSPPCPALTPIHTNCRPVLHISMCEYKYVCMWLTSSFLLLFVPFLTFRHLLLASLLAAQQRVDGRRMLRCDSLRLFWSDWADLLMAVTERLQRVQQWQHQVRRLQS